MEKSINEKSFFFQIESTHRIIAASSQFGLPGSMFIKAFFSSLISAWRARRFSRFSFNRSTSLTTYDRRPAALLAVVWITGAGAGVGCCATDILLVFRIEDDFVDGICDCGGIFSMCSPWPFWFAAVVRAVRWPVQNVHKKKRPMMIQRILLIIPNTEYVNSSIIIICHNNKGVWQIFGEIIVFLLFRCVKNCFEELNTMRVSLFVSVKLDWYSIAQS